MLCKVKTLFVILFCAINFALSAYDVTGHRIIASIAYQNLNAATRNRVDKLLGKQGIVYEAGWADEIRSDDNYAYSYQWHYQNLKDSLTSKDLKFLLEQPKAEGKHLFFALDSLSGELKKNPNNAEALKFIVHFVGDLHQPMHLGRVDDLGGNKIMVKWFGAKSNLHRVWDSQLLESSKYSYSEYSIYLQNKFEPQRATYQKFSLLQSVEAVYGLRNQIYAYDLPTETNNYKYIYLFSDKLDEMLYLGGIQLANVLNGIYSK
ncbi:MAG TPA: S1/P1 nuclease [Paludibacteraceae bacterium]|nr:S1/P1 nuclease [Paludibacteraceae bacterium]HOL28720.1 S1/P1 nuclease [Paludibacteraceae bacterium]HPQ11995.1 S1/P1 nuclease [Paludibacteraceae bacterium]